MNTVEMKALSNEIGKVMPWINGITSDSQYDELIELMGQLIEDSEENEVLIDMLFPVLEHYEETAERFRSFNERIEKMDQGVAMLNVIIDQHNLTYSDLPEIGGKSLVSMILNGTRSLTLSHIRALSKRFGIPPEMFI